jgi:hypothetical protein
MRARRFGTVPATVGNQRMLSIVTPNQKRRTSWMTNDTSNIDGANRWWHLRGLPTVFSEDPSQNRCIIGGRGGIFERLFRFMQSEQSIHSILHSIFDSIPSKRTNRTHSIHSSLGCVVVLVLCRLVFVLQIVHIYLLHCIPIPCLHSFLAFYILWPADRSTTITTHHALSRPRRRRHWLLC